MADFVRSGQDRHDYGNLMDMPAPNPPKPSARGPRTIDELRPNGWLREEWLWFMPRTSKLYKLDDKGNALAARRLKNTQTARA